MSLFERDISKHTDSPGDARGDAPAPRGSNAEAEDSASHIADLVRRTTERQARPGPSSVARPVVTVVRQPPISQRMTQPDITGPDTPRPDAPRPDAPRPDITGPDAPRTRLAMRQPSRRMLVAAGAVAVVLIGGGLALSHPSGSGTALTAGKAPTAPAVSSAPAGYSVKVTDVITDCASHARGLTKTSFGRQNCVKATRSLATGRVGDRPALFVISRIQMASAEAAATVKQVLDGSGTGNLNDLLREGKGFPRAPDKMPSSGYTSVQSGKVVTVAEAGFVDDGRSSSTDPALRAAAAQVAALVNAQR
jgi:hypothetical protein